MKETVAVTAVGTKEITMKVAEIDQESVSVLEDLSQRINLGTDIFEDRTLSRKTIDGCVEILRGFNRVARQYEADQEQVVLTPAVQEAENADILVDNLASFADVRVTVLSLNRELEYYYRFLQREWLTPGTSAALLKVGGGNSLLSLMGTTGEEASILFSRAVPIGPIRLKELFAQSPYEENTRTRFQRQVIKHEFQSYESHRPEGSTETLFALGPEVRMLADFLLKEKEFSPDRIKALIEELDQSTSEQLFHRHRVPLEAAESLLTAAQIVYQAALTLRVGSIRILETGILDGILENHLLNKNEEEAVRQIEQQLYRDSLLLGRSFSFDEPHARLILSFSLQVYERLAPLHKLPGRARLYLVVAALLHDVGQGIAIPSHHKHSQYIINTQEMLFLSDHEVQLAGFIARYHRKSLPKKSHSDYQRLSQEDRIIVLKCAAILRVCDSLDYSHLQLIREIDLHLKKSELVLRARCTETPLGEIHSFDKKKDLMEALFGLKMKLKVEVDE